MNPSARRLRNVLGALIACIALGCVRDSRYRELQQRGDEIVTKIEQFRRDSARLPQSLTAIGVEETESGPLYYDKRSDTTYIVWFGTTLGESVIWSSVTRRWDPSSHR